MEISIEYQVKYQTDVLVDIKKLPKQDKERIKEAIDQRLKIDPLSYGKPLRYNTKGLRSYESRTL